MRKLANIFCLLTNNNSREQDFATCQSVKPCKSPTSSLPPAFFTSVLILSPRLMIAQRRICLDTSVNFVIGKYLVASISNVVDECWLESSHILTVLGGFQRGKLKKGYDFITDIQFWYVRMLPTVLVSHQLIHKEPYILHHYSPVQPLAFSPHHCNLPQYP